MEKSTKYLLTGFVIAIVISIGGYITQLREESQLETLVTKCEAENKSAPKGPWLAYQTAPLVCKPSELSSLSIADTVGIQKEIVTASMSLGNIFKQSVMIALCILLLFSLPAIWYFILRRVRELAKAIRNEG
ncbi:MAG: hypothetical protein JAZ17_11730 [Candidatus Thiodiazotropha endolucinida]|uniref:Uncharacterized protein n=1 Tax=Candidatus Thiodiazotropha taylori TaxID=2792791 RepID=A0A9E4TUH8_9GAMM|nr:hypothetical protein [Candidatus Thiodiazotropha taylori]MCG8094270.1 hypothetical protein [Candidatus Thiodiazotropha endolucinida]MCG8048886.1 hypothetical protein [Candidatus Thiodiazotropha taylori]MCG8072087.1 hypothetical protein [Candidatus Thiodiazotropha taylori]MCW4237896.1 hypothetical protein [Candidatus Thiodiazotropha endolucinida]